MVLVAALVSLLGDVRTVDARPCGGASAAYALAEASLVVKGSLVSTRSSGLPGDDSTSVIRVERVLKGASTQREIAVTHFLCGLEYTRALREGRPLIAFVNATGGLVNGTAVLPASRQSAETGSTDPKAALESELLLASTDEDPATVRAAIGALAELEGARSSPALNRAAKSNEFGVRVRALTWLTRFGDANAFQELGAMLATWPFAPSAIPTMIRDDNAAALAIAHEDVVRALSSFAERHFDVATTPSPDAPRFVEIMTRISQSKDVYIRHAAFEALRGFKDQASFQTLIDALDDQDDFVRYNAMFTLCRAMKAPDMPCPSVPLFQQDPQKYIDRIRVWWKTQ